MGEQRELTVVFETRWEFIRPHVERRDVLDVGPAELVGTLNRNKLKRWIHGRIREVAGSVVGLDVNEEQVGALSEMGFDIQLGNAENFNLERKFEAIVAGELIEHLSNPGMFLDCARNHMVNGGKLVITTPNRFSVLTLQELLISGKVPGYTKPIARHVAFFDADSLTSLLIRHGFRDIQTNYCRWVGLPGKSLRARLLTEVSRRYRPEMSPVLLATASL